jgi:hypothetical protein
LAVALVLATPVHAQAVDDSVSTYIAEGTVGRWRAGLNVTVRARQTVEAAHYYYASRGIDIPLTARSVNQTIELDEPGGGHFTLHLTNGDVREPRPLTFYTSTGLAGTWTRNGASLPVTFGFGTVLNGSSPVRWYADITDQSDAAFEARVRSFLRGVASGNRPQVVAAMSYPVTINAKHPIVIRDRAALLARWSDVFTPAYVAQLGKAMPHEMFVRNGMAMVSSGAVWFDARGARILNLP